MNKPENAIPFDIEKWKEGYEVVCRNGTVPSDLHYFKDATPPFVLAATVDGELHTWDKRGRVLLTGTHSADLSLRPKMEKWYRRAYWDVLDNISYIVCRSNSSSHLRDNYWEGTRTNNWAGPIEEFEVMVREG